MKVLIDERRRHWLAVREWTGAEEERGGVSGLDMRNGSIFAAKRGGRAACRDSKVAHGNVMDKSQYCAVRVGKTQPAGTAKFRG
jgi:hypothetical protein